MDSRELRDVFGSFVTGVTVVTTMDVEGNYQGVTANSFSSVSLDPPLVLWSQARNAKSFPAFRDAQHFVVNILAEHQKDLSQRFARSGNKFEGVKTVPRIGGAPALPECCAYVDCRQVAMYPGGDHVVFLGQVEAIERNARRPLAFAHGKYMLAYDHEFDFANFSGDAAHLAHNEAVRIASAALPEIASALNAMLGLAVWGNMGATIIRWELSDRVATKELRTGVVVSPIASATGLLFAAHLPRELTGGFIRDAVAANADPGGLTSGALLAGVEARIAQIRDAGMSRSRQIKYGNVVALSVPVFDNAGLMIFALSAVVPDLGEGRIDEALEERLSAAAQQLSRRLGYRLPERASLERS